MGESSQNENFILIEENQTNENEMYIEKHVERIEGENAQTKNNKVEENGKQIIQGDQEKNIKIFLKLKIFISHL